MSVSKLLSFSTVLMELEGGNKSLIPNGKSRTMPKHIILLRETEA